MRFLSNIIFCLSELHSLAGELVLLFWSTHHVPSLLFHFILMFGLSCTVSSFFIFFRPFWEVFRRGEAAIFLSRFFIFSNCRNFFFVLPSILFAFIGVPFLYSTYFLPTEQPFSSIPHRFSAFLTPTSFSLFLSLAFLPSLSFFSLLAGCTSTLNLPTLSSPNFYNYIIYTFCSHLFQTCSSVILKIRWQKLFGYEQLIEVWD